MSDDAAAWTPPTEIELLDADDLEMVDDLIRALAAVKSAAPGEGQPDVGTFDPYAEANLGWLKAARAQADEEK